MLVLPLAELAFAVAGGGAGGDPPSRAPAYESATGKLYCFVDHFGIELQAAPYDAKGQPVKTAAEATHWIMARES